MAHAFNRVGTPRASNFKFQISNTKSQIEQRRPAGHAVKPSNANHVRSNLDIHVLLHNHQIHC